MVALLIGYFRWQWLWAKSQTFLPCSVLADIKLHCLLELPPAAPHQQQHCGAMACALYVFPFPQMLGSAMRWPGGKGQVGPAASLGFRVSCSSSRQRHSLEWPFVHTELGEPEQAVLVVLEVSDERCFIERFLYFSKFEIFTKYLFTNSFSGWIELFCNILTTTQLNISLTFE